MSHVNLPIKNVDFMANWLRNCKQYPEKWRGLQFLGYKNKLFSVFELQLFENSRQLLSTDGVLLVKYDRVINLFDDAPYFNFGYCIATKIVELLERFPKDTVYFSVSEMTEYEAVTIAQRNNLCVGLADGYWQFRRK